MGDDGTCRGTSRPDPWLPAVEHAEVGGAVDGDRHQRLWRLVTDRAGLRAYSGWAGVVCDVAVEAVTIDGAAITLRASPRTQELAAASGTWARGLEELQFTVGEGPGVDAFAASGPMFHSDLGTDDDRWPGFVDAATEAGLCAVFAFPLHTGAIRLGTLDLYRRRPGGLSPDELADAAILADLATTALLTDASPSGGAPWAREDAPGHYDDVNVATGMLAAELSISLDDAFLRLRAHAFSQGRPLLAVARALLSRSLHSESFQD